MPVVGGLARYLAAVLCLLAGPGVLVGAAGDSESSSAGPDPQVSSVAGEPDPPARTNGRSDERVPAGTYLAPAGVEPGLLLDVPAGCDQHPPLPRRVSTSASQIPTATPPSSPWSS